MHWQQHPTRHPLYGYLPPITKTIQVRRTRHAGHCWRSRDELIRDVLLWTPTHGRAKAGRPARTCIQQLCEDTGCCPEDLPRAMNDREEWRERVRDIRATSAIWWWWSRIRLTVLNHRCLLLSIENVYVYFFFFTQFIMFIVTMHRRCLWCNGYHRRKWRQRHKFNSCMRPITFHIALTPLGKAWIQLFSLQL